MLVSMLLSDYKANRGNVKGLFIVLNFRLANYFACNNFYIVKVISLPLIIFYKFFFHYIMGIEIPLKTKIGKGLKIYHGFAIVINPNTIIGDDVLLRHCTTIGNKYENSKCPIIGNNVEIGCNCIIIGDIKVGNDTIIGAGSLVNKSIPDNSIAYGNPLIIKTRHSNE